MTPISKEELQEKLYDERFDRLDEKLDDIKDMLGSKASSGSVFRLETRMKNLEDSHIPCATVTIVKNQVDDMEERMKPAIKAIESVVYFSKHPKQLKMVLIGALILFIASVLGLLPSYYMLNKLRIIPTEQVQNIPK